MTFFHVLNYAIPITFIGLFGFLLDRMCKPSQVTVSTNNIENKETVE